MDGVGAFAIIHVLVIYVSIYTTVCSDDQGYSSTRVPSGIGLVEKYVITIEEYLDKLNDESRQNQIQYILQECRDTKLCGMTLAGGSHTGLGCCIRCSCNDTCQRTQSCCPHVYSEIPSGISPVTDMTCSYAEMSKDGAYNGEQYLFYTTCPDDATPAETTSCERRGFAEEASFADVVPVSDTRMKLNYINKHCAACHGVHTEDLTVWKVHVGCNFGNNDWSDLAKMVAHRDDCGVMFKPPDELDVTPLKCLGDSISTCNVTGRWATYDPLLETACQEVPLRYRLELSDGQTKTYRNPFCALCNGEDIIRDIRFSECSSNNVNSLYNLLVSVSLAATEQTEEACSKGGVFDPILGSCRSVDCPMPLVMVPGERVCRSTVEYISYALFTVPFKITMSGETLDFQSAGDIGQFVLDAIEPKINSRHPYLSVCSVHFFFKLKYSYKPAPSLSVSLPIAEVFILTHIHVRNSDPREEFDRIVTEIMSSSMKIGGTNVTISHGYVDGTLQTPEVLYCAGFSTSKLEKPMIWMGQQSISEVTLFEDPYDHMSIVGDIRYPMLAFCETEARLYDCGFISCPVLVYDLDKTGITRVPAGLMLGGELIEFGQFQSVNESHVAVCFDTVKSMPVWSGGYQHNIRVGGLILVCITGVPLQLLLY